MGAFACPIETKHSLMLEDRDGNLKLIYRTLLHFRELTVLSRIR